MSEIQTNIAVLAKLLIEEVAKLPNKSMGDFSIQLNNAEVIIKAKWEQVK